MDKKGNCYVTGTFEGVSFFLGNIELRGQGNKDIFVAKYDSDGNLLWAKSAGGKFTEGPTGIAVDGNGNCYITGTFSSDTLSLGNSFLKNYKVSVWTYDIFIAKYDSEGEIIWVKSAGSTGSEATGGIVADKNQNIYITGSFSDSIIHFDSLILKNKSSIKNANANFIVKYSTGGKIIWIKTLDGKNHGFATCIALDKYGNPYISGSYSETFVFGKDTIKNSGTYLVKYDLLGNPSWGTSTIEVWSGEYPSLIIDNKGNSYLTGTFDNETLNFQSKTLKNAGWVDFFIVKFDSIGNEIWANSAGGTETDGARSVTVDSKGNCFITGYSTSPLLTLGNNIMVNPEQFQNMFVIKYGIKGDLVWAKFADKNTNAICGNDIVADSLGKLIIVGEFSGTDVRLGKEVLNNNLNGSAFFIAKLDTSAATGSILEKISIGSIIIYPNPSKGQIKIISPINIQEVIITNILGQIIYESKPNLKEVFLNLERKGIYFVNIKTEGQTIVRKILVER